MLQRLKSDAVDDYVRAHEDVPDLVVEAMNKAGVETYELYVHDDVAIGIMDSLPGEVRGDLRERP